MDDVIYHDVIYYNSREDEDFDLPELIEYINKTNLPDVTKEGLIKKFEMAYSNNLQFEFYTNESSYVIFRWLKSLK